MNEYMITQHNKVVKPQDKWYCLGDLAIGKTTKAFEFLNRMNGEKILIKGNHDIAPLSVYAQYFKDVRACCALDGVLLTHIPIHNESFSKWKLNAHGHLHYHRVMLDRSPAALHANIPDPRYLNMSMECLPDYTPLSLEEVKKYIVE